MDFNTFDIRAHMIAQYLAQGSTTDEARNIGFELEHFIVEKDSHKPVPYLSNHEMGKPGVEEILKRLAEFFDECIYEPPGIEHSNDPAARLIGLARHHAVITLEPGAQLEISIGPVSSIAEIEGIYRLFREQLDPILEEMGFEAITWGYHPSACAHEIPLIPKDRYHHMDKYFNQTGSRGICMMRATAAVQVSIDYKDEDDAVRKLRIAHALGPFFAFITDNAPVFEGVVVGDRQQGMSSSRSGLPIPKRMARTTTWDDCDPFRCLTPSILFDEDFGFLSYAEALLQAPAVFSYTSDIGASGTIYEGFRPFSQVVSPHSIDKKTIEHILSLFFFDTRFKQYIEIRQADSLPLAYSLAFVALIKGIFYHEDALEYYKRRFEYLDPAAIAFAKTALRKQAYDACIYQRPATEWLDELISFAYAGLSDDERHYLTPLADLVSQRTTLLDSKKL